MAKEEFKPKSLAQFFEPPVGFVGTFGWLCGYSADPAFMEDALERFSGLIDKRRAFAGQIKLCLMLDPGNAQISSVEVPGLLHLAFEPGPRPFNLLHAKVALLGFHSLSHPQEWRLRLIVSTGNWTRQTLEDSLDLVWSIDVSSADLAGEPNKKAGQRLADIAAAWHFLDWLRGYFDHRLLDTVSQAGGISDKQVLNWLSQIASLADLPAPRFFDTRRQSILDQLPGLVRAAGKAVSRNYLGLGSGFFEAPTTAGKVPPVLADIVARLQEQSLVTKAAEVNIFVDPQACQAIATSALALAERGWLVREAGHPSYFGDRKRSLHAKFLFSANYRENSNICNSAWVYLGSGNLTRAGFGQRMSPKVGNLEAGVVFASEKLFWAPGSDAKASNTVTNVLPIQWDSTVSESRQQLTAGEEMLDRPDLFICAPIAYLTWHADGDLVSDAGWLIGLDDQPVEVLDPSGAVLEQEDGKVRWTDGQPRQVPIRWDADGQQYSVLVPVIDKFGRVAATPLHALTLDDAWLHLANFPMPPDDDDVVDGGNEDASPAMLPSNTGSGVSSYPVRQIMQLIENIAERQVSISALDWSAWCVRMEQTLVMAGNSEVLGQFRELGLNPLSPLWHLPFRPAFAESNSTAEGQRYEAILARVEKAWHVNQFNTFGGNHAASV